MKSIISIYKLIIIVSLVLTHTGVFSQAGGTTCPNMEPTCTDAGINFQANSGGPNVLVSEPGNNYGCLGTSPNPSWFYFEIATAGDIIMELSAPSDIDFIIWGPYPNLAAAQATCGNHQNIVPDINCGFFGCDAEGCSWSTSATETPGIPNAQVGEVYVMLITNYANNVQNITLTQTGGSGATDCNIVFPTCSIDNFTANIGSCNSGTNTYGISGTVQFSSPPSSGNLIVEDCSGTQHTIASAPFNTSAVLNYNVTGLTADGAPCNLNLYFDADPACTDVINYTAPNPCTVSCSVTGITTNVGACSPGDIYSVSGQVSFVNAPTSGDLTISSSCGGSVTYSYPFPASPIVYDFPGLPADGSACSVTASFSATSCTLSENYNAPPSCLTCNISGVTANASSCNNNTYSLSGEVSYSNAPTSGTLTVTNSCGTTETFNYPFPASPVAYSFSGLTADGANCSVTASFSAAACTLSEDYTAPSPCVFPCNISGVTANASSCNNNTYSLSGEVSYSNAPTSGILTVTNSCGTTETFNYPFPASPVAYSFSGLTADGANCSVTASFSAVACTLSEDYTAPSPCVFPCNISGITTNVGNCTGSTYSISGQVTYVNAPSSGTITISGSCGGAFTYSYPFPPSPISYNFSGLPANGSSCSITASFSDTICILSEDYTAPEIPNANAGLSQILNCVTNSVVLNGSSSTSGVDYSWSGPGIVSGGSTLTPTVDQPGTYTLTVTSPNYNCINTSDVIITQDTVQPSATFIADTLIGCGFLPVNFQETSGQSGMNYSWSFGNGNTSNAGSSVSEIFSQIGCYDISLTVTDPTNGCTNSEIKMDYICVIAQPIADFSASPTVFETLNGVVNFTNTSSNATDYIWDFGDETPTSTVVDPSHDYSTIAGNFTIELVASNQGICFDTAYYQVQVKESEIFYIPNTFTPDGDSYNETFKAIFTSGFDPYNYTMLIYNRWGEIIWESHDWTVGWNGTFGGNIVQDGIYTWKIEVKTTSKDDRRVYTGHVNIIR